MTTDELPADKLVSIYRKIRGAMEEKEAEHKAYMGGLREQIDVITASLLALCNSQNVDSLRTAEGTVTRRTVTRYWTNDWGAMYQFIKEQDAPHLLEQRLHNTNMREFLTDNPGVLPLGLNADTKYAVTVRKPSNK